MPKIQKEVTEYDGRPIPDKLLDARKTPEEIEKSWREIEERARKMMNDEET